MTTLAAAFRARREADEAASGDLEAELRGIVARARAACPSVAISDEHFVAALAERVERAADPMIALRSTHADDLFLAIACAAGDRVALERFEELFVPDLRQSLLRMGLSESAASEALQQLRHDLFVPSAGERAKMLGYSAHGALRGWLRAVSGRTGLRVLRKSGRGDEVGDSFAAPTDDPELEYLKREYAGPFEEAYREALGALTPPDRLLLKQRFRHGLSLDDLRLLYGVHASTMSRRVADARERLVSATRDGMMRRLKVSRAEVSSILRLIQSEIEISLSQTREPEHQVPSGAA